MQIKQEEIQLHGFSFAWKLPFHSLKIISSTFFFCLKNADSSRRNIQASTVHISNWSKFCSVFQSKGTLTSKRLCYLFYWPGICREGQISDPLDALWHNMFPNARLVFVFFNAEAEIGENPAAEGSWNFNFYKSSSSWLSFFWEIPSLNRQSQSLNQWLTGLLY